MRTRSSNGSAARACDHFSRRSTMPCAAAFSPSTPRGSGRPIRRGTTVACCCDFPVCSSWRYASWRAKKMAQLTPRTRRAPSSALLQVLALHAYLGRDRAGVAHVLVVMDVFSNLEIVEVSGQQRVAVEVEQAAFFRQQESEILLRRDLGDLAQRLVFGVVIPGLGTAVAPLFEVEQLPFCNAERLVDGFVQVRMPVFPQQVLGLVADDQVAATGNAEFDVDHWRNSAGEVLGPLIDPDPARDQPAVKSFQVGDAGADFLLRPIRTFDIMKGDLQRHLKHRQLHILGAFPPSY